MSERKYEVYENENKIASNMSLEMALLSRDTRERPRMARKSLRRES